MTSSPVLEKRPVLGAPRSQSMHFASLEAKRPVQHFVSTTTTAVHTRVPSCIHSNYAYEKSENKGGKEKIILIFHISVVLAKNKLRTVTNGTSWKVKLHVLQYNCMPAVFCGPGGLELLDGYGQLEGRIYLEVCLHQGNVDCNKNLSLVCIWTQFFSDLIQLEYLQ